MIANSDICCRYECIENDLLGSLHLGIHSIAPYKSKGIERASELSVCWNNKVNTGKCLGRSCLNNELDPFDANVAILCASHDVLKRNFE